MKTAMEAIGRAIKAALSFGSIDRGPDIVHEARAARTEAEQVVKELNRLRTLSRPPRQPPKPREAGGGQ